MLSTLCESLRKDGIQVFIESIQKQNCHVFMGGSRRFGYNTTCSDFDLFIHHENSKHMWGWLIEEGFEKISGCYSGSDAGFKRSFLGTGIHVNLITKKKKFEELKRDHENLYDFLQRHPDILSFLSFQIMEKLIDTKGSTIYMFLMKYIEANKKKEEVKEAA